MSRLDRRAGIYAVAAVAGDAPPHARPALAAFVVEQLHVLPPADCARVVRALAESGCAAHLAAALVAHSLASSRRRVTAGLLAGGSAS